MSIKTLRKRIALVAVSALGAGLLSVTPAFAGAAAAGEFDFATQSNTVNVGGCYIANSNTAGSTVGVFLAGTQVTLVNANGADDAYLKLTGAANFVSHDGDSGTLTPTTYSDADPDTNDEIVIQLGGAGTVTVSYRATSTGSLVDKITITVVTACGGGVLSLADSNVTVVDKAEADANSASGDAWETAYDGQDTAYASVQDAGESGYIRGILVDEYGNELDEAAMVATTSAGCLVSIEDTDNNEPAMNLTAASDVMASTGLDFRVEVAQVDATKPITCSVSVTYDGTVVVSKNIKFRGIAASITVSSVTAGERGGSGYYQVTVKDSAGNLLGDVALSNSSTNATNVAAATIVSDASSNDQTTEADESSASYGKTAAVTAANIGAGDVMTFDCTAKGGAAKVTIRAYVGSLTYVTSDAFDVYCGGAAVDTYTISLDKAQYAPGEIATLTVTGKDSEGFFVQSLLDMPSAPVASFGGMEFITTPADADLFNSGLGSKKYTLKVGTTEGAFVGTFQIDADTDDAAKTIQYKIVAPATGAVSNAEVLAAIVKLIASINKQIRALQKSLKRR